MTHLESEFAIENALFLTELIEFQNYLIDKLILPPAPPKQKQQQQGSSGSHKRSAMSSIDSNSTAGSSASTPHSINASMRPKIVFKSSKSIPDQSTLSITETEVTTTTTTTTMTNTNVRTITKINTVSALPVMNNNYAQLPSPIDGCLIDSILQGNPDSNASPPNILTPTLSLNSIVGVNRYPSNNSSINNININSGQKNPFRYLNYNLASSVPKSPFIAQMEKELGKHKCSLSQMTRRLTNSNTPIEIIDDNNINGNNTNSENSGNDTSSDIEKEKEKEKDKGKYCLFVVIGVFCSLYKKYIEAGKAELEINISSRVRYNLECQFNLLCKQYYQQIWIKNQNFDINQSQRKRDSKKLNNPTVTVEMSEHASNSSHYLQDGCEFECTQEQFVQFWNELIAAGREITRLLEGSASRCTYHVSLSEMS